MQTDKFIKAAFATNNSKQVNADFEHASQFVIYEISDSEERKLPSITYSTPTNDAVCEPEVKEKSDKKSGGCGGGKQKDDSVDKQVVIDRAASLAGAAVLFVNKPLNAYSGLELNKERVFTVKVDTPMNITDVVVRLQEMLRQDPPLWLRRHLNNGVVELTEQ